MVKIQSPLLLSTIQENGFRISTRHPKRTSLHLVKAFKNQELNKQDEYKIRIAEADAPIFPAIAQKLAGKVFSGQLPFTPKNLDKAQNNFGVRASIHHRIFPLQQTKKAHPLERRARKSAPPRFAATQARSIQV